MCLFPCRNTDWDIVWSSTSWHKLERAPLEGKKKKKHIVSRQQGASSLAGRNKQLISLQSLRILCPRSAPTFSLVLVLLCFMNSILSAGHAASSFGKAGGKLHPPCNGAQYKLEAGYLDVTLNSAPY